VKRLIELPPCRNHQACSVFKVSPQLLVGTHSPPDLAVCQPNSEVFVLVCVNLCILLPAEDSGSRVARFKEIRTLT